MKQHAALALLALHSDQPFWLRRELVQERAALLLAVGLSILTPVQPVAVSVRRRRPRA